METIAVIDFETTGMSPDDGSRATEIAVVLIREGRIVDRYQSLMNARVQIPYFIVQLTGITNAMIRSAPPAAEVMRQAAEFIGDCPLIAHNAAFDRKFLDAELARINQCRRQEFACTVLLARRLYPGRPQPQARYPGAVRRSAGRRSSPPGARRRRDDRSPAAAHGNRPEKSLPPAGGQSRTVAPHSKDLTNRDRPLYRTLSETTAGPLSNQRYKLISAPADPPGGFSTLRRGANRVWDHYSLPPLERRNLDGVQCTSSAAMASLQGCPITVVRA